MSPTKKRNVLKSIALIAVCFLAGSGWWLSGHIQRVDPAFKASVPHPAFPFTPGTPHPRVAIDAGHHEFQQLDGRYAPLGDLLRADGFQVIVHEGSFSAVELERVQVLIVANAMGASLPVLPSARHTAFTETEMDALREWVRGGGALLLVADHEPIGDANRALSAKFGVDMRSARTVDFVRYDSVSGSPAWVVFERSRGEIGDHAITRGRDSTTRVDKVIAFAGQSLGTPVGATALLVLGDSAFDRLPNGEFQPAKGRAMAVALSLGKGRVVVLGEAAMLTAQVTRRGKLAFGFQLPRSQDQRFALNVVEWLAGAP